MIVGTPCVGKTTVAQMLASRIDALSVNLTDLALREGLILYKDEERGSGVVNESRMRQKIRELIRDCSKNNVVVDGFYAASVVPEEIVTHIFVLRRDPVELRMLMEKRGFSGRKLWENLACEILDVCLFDVLNVYDERKVCELDVSSRTSEDIVTTILDVLSDSEKCLTRTVDWLSKLENDGVLKDFLRF